jgi:NADPH:quinone reductase-like Zn-dependent oxidoreductase
LFNGRQRDLSQGLAHARINTCSDHLTSAVPTSEAFTVIITGASSGVGLHAAHSLAERAWFVVVACRDPAKAARLAQQAGIAP